MIRYCFAFADGEREEFHVDEQAPAAAPLRSSKGLPIWMDLDTHRCPHCPLPRNQHVVCPAMNAIAPTIQLFDRRASTDLCDLTVSQNDVTHQAHTPVQNAVRALIGLQFALSACPTLSRLRPLARFHAPLSSADETVFRVFGMYMLEQYLRQTQGERPDWHLDGLHALYHDIHTVNNRLAARIRDASHKDATVNGVVILDALAHVVEHNIHTRLAELIPSFVPQA
jgi:hypothetical protein